MSLRTTYTVELRSINGAQAESPYLNCAGSRVQAHILLAPGDLVGIQGGSNNNPADAVTLMVRAIVAGGLAAAAALPAGYYVVVERPNWIRVVITTDVTGPRTSRVDLMLDPEE